MIEYLVVWMAKLILITRCLYNLERHMEYRLLGVNYVKLAHHSACTVKDIEIKS